MSGRYFLLALIVLSVIGGYPYAGLALNRVLGTAPVEFIEHDGSRRTLIMGPNAPRPPWVPIMPSSLVITAAHWVPGPTQRPAGDVELLSHAGLNEIKAFYLERLREEGFVMNDFGIEPMTPEVASWLGHSGSLVGWREETGTEVTVHIRTPEGIFFPSRAIQVLWRDTDDPWSKTGRAERDHHP